MKEFKTIYNECRLMQMTMQMCRKGGEGHTHLSEVSRSGWLEGSVLAAGFQANHTFWFKMTFLCNLIKPQKPGMVSRTIHIAVSRSYSPWTLQPLPTPLL